MRSNEWKDVLDGLILGLILVMIGDQVLRLLCRILF